ncbi:MAG: ABC transporter ATP-binding protein [candidate division Zixibacteria bacterium]|nr:ABC transporter ATP-binding protein [candidate division Zixibacteria bacterium]
MGLTLDNVKRSFGKTFHLSLDMRVEQGITVLFGRSGCGKTSVLRLIAGLDRPDAGTIRFDDTVFFDPARKTDLPPHLRRIGYMFQLPSLFPHLTVHANIAYGATDSSDVAEWLERFQLSALKDRYPREISGGEMQRVALARSLASRPRLLLLDEPFSALDEQRRTQFQGDLLRLKDKMPIPILLVTHNLNEAFALADRLIILDEGKIVESYDAMTLFSRPMKRVTAELLRVQNLLPCTVRAVRNDTLVVDTGHFTVELDPDARFHSGDRVWLGIRAVDVRLIVTDEFRENEIAATVSRIVPAFGSNHVLLRSDGCAQEYDLVMDLDEHHLRQHMLRAGDRVRISLKRANAFLCD